MKLFPAAIVASAALVAACENPTDTTVVTPVEVASADATALSTATGLPGESVVAVSRTGSQYVVFYREEGVTAEQLADAPERICANTGSTVFAEQNVDTGGPSFQDGSVQKMTVTCN